ncbi:type II secretion system major pseudopilin GspG [Hyphomonas sp.]|uniref:type II secretion system major pseudopilin GspG n=1 Tax=Hyphomonas sp. TaxID=87 RepID=UPI003527E1AB
MLQGGHRAAWSNCPVNQFSVMTATNGQTGVNIAYPFNQVKKPGAGIVFACKARHGLGKIHLLRIRPCAFLKRQGLGKGILDMSKPNRGRTGEAGFSLMEILVALVILALIVGVVGPRVIGYLSRAKSQTANVQIQGIKSALDLYLMDVGHYPTQEEGLKALVVEPQGNLGWAGPYLDSEEVPLDPWGNPYHYSTGGEISGFKIISLGRDNAPGGVGEDADVSS